MVKMAGQISIEGGELVMSVAEQLRQEGKIEGRQEGIEEGIKRTAKIMIVDGEAIEKIIRYTRLTEEEIDEIKEAIASIRHHFFLPQVTISYVMKKT